MVKERNCLTVRERLFPALSSWPLSSSRHRFYFANNDEKKFTSSISSYALSLSHQFYTLVIYLNYMQHYMFLLFLFRPFIFPFTFNLNPQNLSWYKISPLMLIHSSLQRSAASVAKHAPPPLLLVQLVQKRVARSVLRRFLLEFEAGKRRLRM